MILATTQQTVRMARPGRSKARFNPLRKILDKTKSEDDRFGDDDLFACCSLIIS